jgi:plasmid replication initiation protein
LFDFEEIKQGRKIHSIKFYIKQQKAKDMNFSHTVTEQINIGDEEIETEVVAKKIKNIVDESISRDTVRDLIKEYGIETVNYYLDNWCKFSTIDMKNKAGFFISCIKKNYTPSEHQIGKPVQSMNYEQRQYDDDHYNRGMATIRYKNYNSIKILPNNIIIV